MLDVSFGDAFPGCELEVWLPGSSPFSILVQEHQLEQGLSKCASWTSNIGITWELVRNADCGASPQTKWIRLYRGGVYQSVFTRSPGDSEYTKNLRATALECYRLELCFSVSSATRNLTSMEHWGFEKMFFSQFLIQIPSLLRLSIK